MRMLAIRVVFAFALFVYTTASFSETNFTITSFNNGTLEWTNIDTQLYYNVEWKYSLNSSNDWSSIYRGYQDVRSTNDLIAVPVPMFFRISATSNPVNTIVISPTNPVIQAGYHEAVSLDQVDNDLVPENIKKDVNLFGVTGTYEGAGSAWPAPVARTGQTNSYRAGDDGDLKPGVAWPNPRFTIHAATWTVTDNLTGLMWTRIAGVAGQVDWNTAIDRCNSHDEYGYNDWRLPTLNELQSLVDVRYQFPALCNTAGTAQHTNQNPFYNVQDANYWTSTTRGPLSPYKWYIDMQSGKSSYASGSVGYYYVWPVRNAN